MSRRVQIIRNIAIGVGAFLLLLFVAAIITVQTNWFREYVKNKIIAATEEGTGGRAEIGSFQFEWTHLRAIVNGFVIHGREPAGSPPWIRAARVQVDLHLFPSLTHVLNLAYLGVERPEVRVAVMADGSTNIPTPAHKSTSNETALESVVDLAVGHFDLSNGLLTFDSAKQPMNLRGDNLRVQLWYSVLSQGYHGQVALEPLYVVSGRNTPVKFVVNLPVTLGRDRVDLKGATISTAQSRITIDGTLANLRDPQTSAHVTGRVALADLNNAGNLGLAIDPRQPVQAVNLDLNASVANRAIDVSRLRVAFGQSTIDASGKLKDSNGNGAMIFTSHLALGELGRLAKVAARPDGSLDGSGTARLDANNNYLVTGNLEARNVSFDSGASRITGVRLASSVRFDPHRLDLPDLRLSALGGELDGSASLAEMARYQLSANLRHFDLRTAAGALGEKTFPYAGIASGPVAASGDLKVPGTKSLSAHAKISIAPGPHGIPMNGRLFADYNGAANNIQIADSYIALPSTRLTLNGSPGNRLNVTLTTRDLNDLLAAIPGSRPDVALEPGGQATLTAAVTGSLGAPSISVHLAASRMSVEGRHFDSLATDAAASRSAASVSSGSLTRGAMQMQFAGSVGLRNWTPVARAPLTANASVRNGDLADILALAGGPNHGFSGALSATANIGGTVGNPTGTADLSVTSGTIQGEPFDRLQAQVNMTDRRITIPAAYVTSGAARVDLSAEMQHPADSFSTGQIHARLHTTQVDLARIHAVQGQLPNSSGEVQLQAEVNGELTARGFDLASVNASASARNLRVNGESYGDFNATAQTQQREIRYDVNSNFAGSKITAHGTTRLAPDYPTVADASVAGLPIERVLTLAKRTDIPAKGNLSGTLHFSGTTEKPEGNVDIDLSRAVLYDEAIDRVRAKVTYLAQSVDLENLEVMAGPSLLSLNGKYDHPAGDLETGHLVFHVNDSRVDLKRIHNVQQAKPGLEGAIQLSADGAARIQSSGTRVQLQSLNGNLAAHNVAVQGKQFGNLTLAANTSGSRLNFTLNSDLAQASIQGRGDAQLGGDYPVNAQVSFHNLTWKGLEPLLSATNAEPPAFDAAVDGEVTVNGPVTRTGDLSGKLTLSRLNFHTVPTQAKAKPVTIQNQGPVAVSLNRGAIRIDSLHLTGPDTDLQAHGTGSLQGQGMDINVQANSNLAVLKQFDRDVVSSGSIVLAANVRGDLPRPSITGKLELKDASVNYMQLPNGLSHANGTVQFNGNSASVRNMTAESGGGKLSINGFVAYRDELRFGLRLTSSNVRIRPEQGISALFDANVSVSGTRQSSTATGLVTVNRVTYAPQSDIGSLLSRAAPVQSTNNPSPLLDNMKLDVRIRTATSMAVHASMAQNLQADADLRIRGTASQPGLLGRVTITEGQLVFFNSTYTVNTGTISFYNPVRIEPVLNLSLNTEAKGVQVVLKVTGPIDNMKLTYSSDPPLQFQEIVDLLATGKTPTSDPTILANQPADPPQTFAQMGESAVVSKALADPVAGRLQRVFGVSQLKIDPTFTSGSELPEARVTLQQHISSNLTFTYVTALNNPNTQIIRAEWTLNQQWAAMAMRDENGIVSVRLTYKKQLR